MASRSETTPPASTPSSARLAFAGSRRGRWPALAAWAILAVIGFTLAPRLGGIQDDAQINWLPADAESTEAKHLAETEFNQKNLTSLLVVYTAETPLTPEAHAAAAADRAALDALAAPGERTTGPIPSEDGQALMLVVPLADTAIDADGEALFAEADAIVQEGLPPGLEAGLTGGAAASRDMESAFEQLDGPLTWMTVAVVALVLILTYRSPLLLLLPMVCIALSEQLATGLAYLLGRYADVTINGQNTGILTVLVFGVSTDYTLLLVSRYREELLRTEDRFAAMRAALTASTPAIVASAGTVVLALAVLPLASVSSTAALGPVLIAGVASAVLASLTLLPAVLSLFGRAVFWPLVPRHDPAEAAAPAQRRHRFWGRVAGAVSARPRLIAVATTTGLLLLSLGWTGLSIGLERSELLTTETASQRVSAAMAEHYPAGAFEPVEVYVRDADTDAALAVLEAAPGIAQTEAPVRAADADWVRIDAVLVDEASSDAAEATVRDLRESLAHNDTVSTALVSGPTATQIDLAAGNDRDLRLLVPLILAVVLLVIVLLLRALTAALVLMACTVLSYAAAVGAANLVFKGLGQDNVDTSFLLMGFLFLVAMGIDYTIFLMTRVREEVPRWGHRVGTLRALTVTGGVITSAGLVLAATFTVLALMPLTMLMQLGIVVCAGVLLDAIIVRSLLVPALALWIGERFWWPSRTARRPTPAPAPERQEAND